MIRTKVGRMTYLTEFDNISEMVQFIKQNKPKQRFIDKVGGPDSEDTSSYFVRNTKTNCYADAEELLFHGWEHGAIEIKNKVDCLNTEVGLKQKTVYDVQGFQCSVPRYLQGIPTNMVNKKAIPVKNKIVTINKLATYGWNVEPQTIITESVKVLQLVNRLEKQGYRVNLNVMFAAKKRNASIIKLKIKSASQRLNIKQLAFPLVHPSMLRRIIFAVWERTEECDTDGFEYGYGCPMSYESLKQYIKEGEYIIPNVLYEKEIKNIELFKVKHNNI